MYETPRKYTPILLFANNACQEAYYFGNLAAPSSARFLSGLFSVFSYFSPNLLNDSVGETLALQHHA